MLIVVRVRACYTQIYTYKSSRAILSDGSSGSFHQVSKDSIGVCSCVVVVVVVVVTVVLCTKFSAGLKGTTLHVELSCCWIGGGGGWSSLFSTDKIMQIRENKQNLQPKYIKVSKFTLSDVHY